MNCCDDEFLKNAEISTKTKEKWNQLETNIFQCFCWPGWARAGAALAGLGWLGWGWAAPGPGVKLGWAGLTSTGLGWPCWAGLSWPELSWLELGWAERGLSGLVYPESYPVLSGNKGLAGWGWWLAWLGLAWAGLAWVALGLLSVWKSEVGFSAQKTNVFVIIDGLRWLGRIGKSTRY